MHGGCKIRTTFQLILPDDRTDPDGHDATWYFQQAYDVATAAIASPGNYGLMPTFYEVNLGGNERNKEMLFYADHTQTSEKYTGASLTYGSWWQRR